MTSRKLRLKAVMDWNPARPAQSVTGRDVLPSRPAAARTRICVTYCGKNKKR